MAYNQEGEIVATTERSLVTRRPHPQFVEHDPHALVNAIQSGLDELIEKLGDQVKYIEGAGLATQRSNVVCWDKHTGQALSPIISWQDTRASDALAKLNLDQADIHKTTGLFTSPHYGASKLRWCLEHIPEVKQAHEAGRLYCGPMSSFLIYHLVKEKNCYADPVSASRTLLWHVHRKDWDDYLLKTFGISRDTLPTCVPTCHHFGHLVSKDIEIPLNVVTGDQSAAMFAYGNLQYETAYINIGTGAFVSRPSGYALLYARRLLTSVIYSDKEESQYVLEGTVNGAGSAIEWLQALMPIDNLWEQLPNWLDEIQHPPLFLNGVSGLGAPYWVSQFDTEVPTGASPAESYVGLVESIAFLIHANVQEMMKFASAPQQLQVSGGLARLDGLCQRIADLTGLPVYRPMECEATTRGTAYLVAGMPQQWPENQHGIWFMQHPNGALHQRFNDWEQAMLQRIRHQSNP